MTARAGEFQTGKTEIPRLYLAAPNNSFFEGCQTNAIILGCVFLKMIDTNYLLIKVAWCNNRK